MRSRSHNKAARGRSLKQPRTHRPEHLLTAAKRVQPDLDALADLLLQHTDAPHTRIIAMVGAGASASARLPLGRDLVPRFRKEFLRGGSKRVDSILKAELADAFPGGRKNFNDLSLFEAAAVLSRLSDGRRAVHLAIKRALQRASHRPLAYEMLSHLAKHRFIDHIILLNFDELLDDAIRDELPDRHRIIVGADGVPSPEEFNKDPDRCCIIRPFGSLSAERYDVTADEVAQFGPRRVRDFIHKLARRRDGASSDRLILILIGYAGGEAAFGEFVGRVLGSDTRSLNVFALDPADPLPPGIETLRRYNLQLVHVALEADTALELLLEIMRAKATERHQIWIPVARHKLVATQCLARQLKDPQSRFPFELLLQAVKSRGFVQPDAFSQIPRLNQYADGASEAIHALRRAGILVAHKWIMKRGNSGRRFHHFVPTYSVRTSRVADHLTRLSQRARVLTEWQARINSDTLDVTCYPLRRYDYIVKRLQEIESAPEIEIALRSSPETPWWLGNSAHRLNSIRDLTAKTRDLLTQGLQSDKFLEIRGIWSTGEWLLHRAGWAWPEGHHLLERIRAGTAALRCVLSRTYRGVGRRTTVANSVVATLSKARAQCAHGHQGRQRPPAIEWRSVNWWELNRVLTIILVDRRPIGAVYMRRRLGAPLVEPFLIDGRHTAALATLKEMFGRYFVK